MCRRLRGVSTEVSSLDNVPHLIAPLPPRKANFVNSIVACDIETYGILEGNTQRFFHPKRSMADDGIAPGNLLVSLAFAWETPRGTKAAYFNLTNPDHLRRARRWLHAIRRGRQTLLFHHAQFDLMYLRAGHWTLREALKHDIQIEDALVWLYLDSDVRPERSLKAVSPLLGTVKYTDDELAFVQYDSPMHPDLIKYNIKDAVATLWNRQRLLARIKARFPDVAKASPSTQKWYSDILWLSIYMSEQGIRFDPGKIELVADRAVVDWTQALLHGEKAGFKFAGKGSGKGKGSIPDLIDRVVSQQELSKHPELERTPTTGLVSTSKANQELLLRETPHTNPLRYVIEQLGTYRSAQRLSGTYCRSLIGYPGGFPERKGEPVLKRRLIDGVAYPVWHVVPSGAHADDENVKGTRQGRLIATDPPVMTNPPSIENCMIPSKEGHFLLFRDLSQIEAVMAAVLTGDPRMLEEYRAGVDRHAATAIRIFGEGIVDDPEFKSKFRQVGKHSNFLLIFWGGAKRLQRTIREKAGFEFPIDQCHSVVRDLPLLYPHFRKRQFEWVEEAGKRGYVCDPILGQGRLLSPSRRVTMEEYRSEIVNVPVQAASSNLLSTAQKDAEFTFRKRGLKSRMCLNWYDSMGVDGPIPELEQVTGILDACLTKNWYRDAIEAKFTKIPMSWEDKWLLRENGEVTKHGEWK